MITAPGTQVSLFCTSNLDVENEREIQEAVQRLQGNLTVVVIAHQLSTIRRAERIVVLEQGRVAAVGTWEELARRPGRFRSLLQARGSAPSL